MWRRTARIWVVVSVIALVLGGFTASAMALDTYEPNNTFYTPSGPWMAGSNITSYLSAANDHDYYWFYVSGPSIVHLSLQEPAGLFYGVCLVDPTDKGLDSDHNSDLWNWLPTAQVDYMVTKPGAYRAEVYSYLGGNGGYSGTAPYTLSIWGDAITAPPAVVGRPSAPAKVKKRRKFTVKGSLTPRHAAGRSNVVVEAYFYKKRRWVKRYTVATSNSDYATFSQYRTVLKLSSKGKWRVRAVSPADADHSRGTSGWRNITVK